MIGYALVFAFSSFQHTAARRRLVRYGTVIFEEMWFQHTAARRRLEQAAFKAYF